MGFFDSVIEQTIDLLKRDGELSSCRILKAHPDCFHQSPLSKVTVTVSLGGAQVASAAMGDFLGTRSSGDFYGKSAEVPWISQFGRLCRREARRRGKRPPACAVT